MTDEYTISIEVPAVEDYCRLRRISGLTPRSEVAVIEVDPTYFDIACRRVQDSLSD